MTSRLAACLTACLLLSACVRKEERDAAKKSENASTPSTATTPTSTAPVSIDQVCAFMTREDVAKALGTPINDATPSKSENADLCSYTTASGQIVTIQVFNVDGAYEGSRKTFESVFKTRAEDIPGVGDKAFVLFGTQMVFGTGTAVVQKGPVILATQVMGAGVDANTGRPLALALAKAALAKL